MIKKIEFILTSAILLALEIVIAAHFIFNVSGFKNMFFLQTMALLATYLTAANWYFAASKPLKWEDIKPGFHGTIAAVSADQVVVKLRDAFYVINIESMGIGYSELVPGKNITEGINGEIILSDSAVTIKK